VLVTHDLGIVADLADVVYVMYAGSIVEYRDVFPLYGNPYSAGLLCSVLSIDGFVEELVSIEESVPSLLRPPTGCKFHPRCPIAQDGCRRVCPELQDVGNGHSVACHLEKREH